MPNGFVSSDSVMMKRTFNDFSEMLKKLKDSFTRCRSNGSEPHWDSRKQKSKALRHDCREVLMHILDSTICNSCVKLEFCFEFLTAVIRTCSEDALQTRNSSVI